MRDPETERYELRAQVEAHQELGRELYERRRPDAPKTWLELTETDRAEWILIAVDQAQSAEPREVAEQALAVARAETGLTSPAEPIEQLARWLHHHFDTEHLTWDAESEPGRDYYRKMARAQLSEVPFLAERLAKPVSTGDAALDRQVDEAAFEAGLQHLYDEAKAVIARTIGLARDIGYRQASVEAEDTEREREEKA